MYELRIDRHATGSRKDLPTPLSSKGNPSTSVTSEDTQDTEDTTVDTNCSPHSLQILRSGRRLLAGPISRVSLFPKANRLLNSDGKISKPCFPRLKRKRFWRSLGNTASRTSMWDLTNSRFILAC